MVSIMRASFLPPEQISSLKHLRKPDLRVGNSAICWPVEVEKVLHLHPSLSNLKSIFGFVNKVTRWNLLSVFHGNGTFGECCSSVGKAKVHGDRNNNGRSHQPDFPQTGAELLDLLDTQRSWCFNREDEQVSLKVGAEERQEQWLVATVEQSGKAVVWVLVFSDLLCVYHRVWMRLYKMKVLETWLVACTAHNMICRYQQTDTLATWYDTQEQLH